MARVQNGLEKLQKMSTGWVGCTNSQTTNKRQTDLRRHITERNVVTFGWKILIYVIGNRLHAFQPGIDESHALPLSPQMVYKNVTSQFSHIKLIRSLIKVCDKVFYVKTFSSLVVEKVFSISNGAEMLVANVTFNQTFSRKVTHPLWRYSDCTATKLKPAIKFSYH